MGYPHFWNPPDFSLKSLTFKWAELFPVAFSQVSTQQSQHLFWIGATIDQPATEPLSHGMPWDFSAFWMGKLCVTRCLIWFDAIYAVIPEEKMLFIYLYVLYSPWSPYESSLTQNPSRSRRPTSTEDVTKCHYSKDHSHSSELVRT